MFKEAVDFIYASRSVANLELRIKVVPSPECERDNTRHHVPYVKCPSLTRGGRIVREGRNRVGVAPTKLGMVQGIVLA